MDPNHLSPSEFRALGRRMVDFIADYWEAVGSLRVTPEMRPGDLLAELPSHPPQHGLAATPAPSHPWDPVFHDLSTQILPALTHWQSPHFYGYFPANASFPAILGEMLSAGLGQQGMLWATSPACTELEMRVLDWLAQMLGLPDSFRFGPSSSGGSVLQGTASEALVAALVAARHRATRNHTGPTPHLVAYASTQAHSSFIKACMIVGLASSPEDRTHCRLIEPDDSLAMRPDLLARAMADDRAAGRVPFFVMGTLGTTSSTAIDPIADIARVIQAPHAGPAIKPWLHIDAAHAGSLLICPEFRPLARGIEHADSFCFNPHKWLLTNFDCDCFFTRDRESLTRAMSITPEYLRNAGTDSGAIDYRDWHVPLGRRFRALKLWFVIRHYGVQGLQAHIRGHVRLASLFESWIAASARFELSAPRTMNLVCFRLQPAHADETPTQTDARNRAFLERLNATGRLYLSHTVLPATPARPATRYVLRMAIGATLTREPHVEAAWKLMQELAAREPAHGR